MDTVKRADLAPGIGEHWKGHPTGHHFAQLLFLPHFVYEAAVRTHCQHLSTQVLKFFMTGGDRRQFGGSDEGKIAWIKAQNNPLATEIGKLHGFKPGAFHKGVGFKVRGLSADAGSHRCDLR
jgi:hypothetical protein